MMPLNIYFIAASFCCKNLFDIYQSFAFLKEFNCFKAESIYESNCIIIFGHMNDKLSQFLKENIDPTSRYVIFNLNCCEKKINIKEIVHEARRCLRA